jgi:hypothetical protein
MDEEELQTIPLIPCFNIKMLDFSTLFTAPIPKDYKGSLSFAGSLFPSHLDPTIKDIVKKKGTSSFVLCLKEKNGIGTYISVAKHGNTLLPKLLIPSSLNNYTYLINSIRKISSIPNYRFLLRSL